jgi:hypothetical protein
VLAAGLASLTLARLAFLRGETDLRRWYASQHGRPTGE